LTASAFESILLTSPADKALFTGPGAILLPVGAAATSYATGAGNLRAEFSTFAGAQVYIRYEYSETPEPGTFMLIGVALVGFARLRRKRA
jgi:hypothetical protein